MVGRRSAAVKRRSPATIPLGGSSFLSVGMVFKPVQSHPTRARALWVARAELTRNDILVQLTIAPGLAA